MSVGGENSQELLERWRDVASAFGAKREDKSVRSVRCNRDSWIFRVYSWPNTSIWADTHTRTDSEERYIHMFQRVFAYIIFCGGWRNGLATPSAVIRSERCSLPRVLRRKPLSAGRAEKNARYKRKNFSLPSDWRLPWQHPGHLGL